ncbi:MAG: NAD-binding protein [Halobacteriota archaeon]|nr:NAD-binding protein [Halobacteriota archaeon]
MRSKQRKINPIVSYFIGIINLVLAYTAIFLYLRDEFSGTDRDVITAIYWVVQTITTLGYGEIYPVTPIGKLLVIVIISSGIGAIFVFFPLVLTPLLEKRIRRLPIRVDMSGHIIICGYNALVETLIEELTSLNDKFVLIDDDDRTIRELIEQNIPCIYGDPSDRSVLENACISRSRTLVANKGSEIDANIILTASKLSSAKMMALVDDIAMEKYLTYVGATTVLSPKQLLGSYMGRQALSPLVYETMEVYGVHPELIFEEVLVHSGCDLIGKSIEENEVRRKTGASILGIKKDDSIILNPDPEIVIEEESTLFSIGSEEQLSRLDELTKKGPRKDRGLYILAGYGDVGRQVASILHKKGVDYTIVDIRDVEDECKKRDGANLIVGSATDEGVLKDAGIDKASTFIVALNEDSLNIYATIIARRLSPTIRIISRANSVSTVDKLNDAGADTAFSLSSIGGKMLARTIALNREGKVKLTEKLILGVYKAKDELLDKNLGFLSIRTETGCTIVGLEEDNNFIANPGPSVVINENAELFVAGTKEQLHIFERKYGYRNLFKRKT